LSRSTIEITSTKGCVAEKNETGWV